MSKNLYLFVGVILYFFLVGCNENSEEKSVFQCGIYCSEETSDFVWFQEEQEETGFTYVVDYSYGGNECMWQINGDVVTINGMDKNISFKVIDDETLKLGNVVYKRADLGSNSIEKNNIKEGMYYSYTTNYELKFIEGEEAEYHFCNGSSAGIRHEYVIEDNKLFLGESMVFNILDNDTLMYDNEIFYYTGEWDDGIEDENVFCKGVYRSETTSNYIRLKDEGRAEYLISGRSGSIASDYRATKENILIGDGVERFLFEIVDKKTLKLREEVYKYVEAEAPEVNEGKIYNTGKYCSIDTSDYIWFKSEDTVLYCIDDEKCKPGTYYIINGNKITMYNVYDREKSIVLEIVDKGTLKLNDEVYRYVLDESSVDKE